MNDKNVDSIQAGAQSAPALFRWFPGLRGRIPWVALTRAPARVHPLASIGRSLGMDDLWIKRDDECGIWYGGNKPRKLEFLLGDALSRRSRTVITFGGLGSNHALATAICGRKLDLRVVMVMVRQPLSDEARRNLLLAHSQGAQLVFGGGHNGARWAGVRRWLRHAVADGRPPYLVMPGGSTPRGCLGYVSAALELADQVQAGEAPPPDDIIVPVGSNGTMAGLLVGLSIAGLESRVIGVRVSDQLPTTPEAVAALAGRCRTMLRRHLGSLSRHRMEPGDVTIWDGFLGRGYAHPTSEGLRAVATMAEQEGIRLDDVYTGKTLAALMAAAEDPLFRRRRVLFWNTFNSLSVSDLLPDGYDHRRLPKAFHRMFGA